MADSQDAQVVQVWRAPTPACLFTLLQVSLTHFLHSRTSPRGGGGGGGGRGKEGGGRHRERGEEREREGDGSELMPRHLLCNWAEAGGKEMTVRFYWIIKGRSQGAGQGARSRSLRLVRFGRGSAQRFGPCKEVLPACRRRTWRKGGRGGI